MDSPAAAGDTGPVILPTRARADAMEQIMIEVGPNGSSVVLFTRM